MFGLKHSFESVVEELVVGLRDGTVVLSEVGIHPHDEADSYTNESNPELDLLLLRDLVAAVVEAKSPEFPLEELRELIKVPQVKLPEFRLDELRAISRLPLSSPLSPPEEVDELLRVAYTLLVRSFAVEFSVKLCHEAKNAVHSTKAGSVDAARVNHHISEIMKWSRLVVNASVASVNHLPELARGITSEETEHQNVSAGGDHR